MSNDTSQLAPAGCVGFDVDVFPGERVASAATAGSGRGPGRGTTVHGATPASTPPGTGGAPDAMDATDNMEVTFVGGPWHGETRPCPVPLPPRIDAPDYTVYVPWTSHPATAGILGGPLERDGTYVVEALEARELQKRVEDFLLHRIEGRKS